MNELGEMDQPKPYFTADLSGSEQSGDSLTEFQVESPYFSTKESQIYLSIDQSSQNMDKKLCLRNPWTKEINAQVLLNEDNEIKIHGSVGDDYLMSVNFDCAKQHGNNVCTPRITAEMKLDEFMMKTAAQLSTSDDGAMKMHAEWALNDMHVETFMDYHSNQTSNQNITGGKMGIVTKNIGLDNLRLTLSHSNEHNTSPKEDSFVDVTKSMLDLQVDSNQFLWRTENGYTDVYNWKYHNFIKSPFEGLKKLLTIASCISEADFVTLETLIELEERSMKQLFEAYVDVENDNDRVVSYTSELKSPSDSDRKIFAELRQSYHDVGETYKMTLRENRRELVAINGVHKYSTAETGPSLNINFKSAFSKPINLAAKYDYQDYDSFSMSAELKQPDSFSVQFQTEMNLNDDSPHLEAKLATSLAGREDQEATFMLEYNLIDERKSIASKLVWNETPLFLNASAQIPEGMILDSEILIETPWKNYEMITGLAKLAYDRINVELEKGEDKIQLVAEKKMENDAFLVTADFSSPIQDWESVYIEGTFDPNPNEVI